MRSMIIGILIILLMTPIALARVGGGEVVFTPKKGKGITFSHDFHSTYSRASFSLRAGKVSPGKPGLPFLIVTLKIEDTIL